MSQYTVLFDANVLYPAPMRDALMQLSVTDLFKAKWREWTKHGGHAARFLFATVSRPSRTAALVTATR